MKDTRNLLHRLLVVLAFGSVLHGGQAFAQSELDVVFANSGQDSEICRNQGNFICTEIGLTNHDVGTVAAGDIDSDSLLDIVFTNSGGPYPVCFGDGFGGFECTGQIEPASTAEFALGDVNGDGLLDAVTAEMTQSSRVCIGDGAGSFTCTPIAPDIHFTMGVSLGDVDNDGHLDAVYATSIWPYVVCLGDGTGGFSCSDIQSSATENSRDVALGDFNNDGNLDAAFASMSMMGGDAWNGVCLGDGTGDLSCSPVDSPLLETDCVAVGDMDLDGHLDVVFGNSDQPGRVCFGDGTGAHNSFTCSDISPDASRTADVDVGDVDGDGDLDVMFANALSQQNRVCFGDGSGGFTCTEVGNGEATTYGVALGEFDLSPQQVAAVPDLGRFGRGVLIALMMVGGLFALRKVYT